MTTFFWDLPSPSDDDDSNRLEPAAQSGLGPLPESPSETVLYSRPVPPTDFRSELQASRVYTRTSTLLSHPTAQAANSDGRRAHSFSSEAALFETASLGSSLTLLDSKASTQPSNQSTIYVAPPTAASAADYSVDAALYSFRPSSSYSLSSISSPHPSHHPHHYYNRSIHTLPRPLSRPLPAANPSLPRYSNLNFSAQRARPRSLFIQPPTLTEIHDKISLLHACRYGDTQAVSTLLSQGVDPNSRDTTTPWQEYEAAAIHIATIQGHYDVVRTLLHHGARVDEPFRGFRRPLHESVRRGDNPMTILLLDNGAAVDARDESGYQPLHVAVMENSVPCAKLLVWAGAPVNAVGNDFLTPLHHVAMLSGNMELVELLVGHGANILVRTRWLLGNKLAREIAREKGHGRMETRLIELENLAR